MEIRHGGESYPLGIVQEIVQEIEVWSYEKMVYAQPEICPKNETLKLFVDFKIPTDRLTSVRRRDLETAKKENLPNCGFRRPGRP